MEKEIKERLRELLDEQEIEEEKITIVLQGTPVINIYLGSEE